SNGLLRLKASIVFARFRWGEGSKKRRESACTKNARNGAGIGSAITEYALFLQAGVQLLTRHTFIDAGNNRVHRDHNGGRRAGHRGGKRCSRSASAARAGESAVRFDGTFENPHGYRRNKAKSLHRL
ncbi:MAG: hypothetical protein Q7T27_21470, partial [Pseudomonas sp.]|uniref:hypothetical protein n=1 Tax=Pseudomonas sp. TaxID=306 RepID=UPI00271970C8